MKSRLLLSTVLVAILMASLFVPFVAAQDPATDDVGVDLPDPGTEALIEANPSGQVSGPGAWVGGTGTLWENGEPDGVNGLSSEEGTNVPYSRTADDFYLDDSCPLYNIDVIRVILLQDPGIIDAGIELFLDNGGQPDDAVYFSQWGYDTKTYVGNWFSRDAYEFEFFTPGLQLAPGTYWLSGINWQGSGQGFWLTASPGWGSQIYFKSDHFGFPNWVTGDQVFGAQYNVAFDIDGGCAGGEPDMFVRKTRLSYREITGGNRIRAEVTIWDNTDTPVPGADVFVDWTFPDRNGFSRVATTDAAGKATFFVNSQQFGKHRICVTDVQAAGYVYNPGMNHFSCRAIVIGEEPPPYLYDNCPFITHPGGGYGGADASALQTTLGMGTYGFGHQLYYGYRVADDFEIIDPTGWNVDEIYFYAYQTNSGTGSTITQVNFQIWDGPPDDPMSSVVFGDTSTNRLTDSYWTNVYRVLDTDLANTARPIMEDVTSAGTWLAPGTYWLDWQSDGSLSSGPWANPCTILGQTTTGNAMQSLDGGVTWAPLVDVGPQGLPFVIFGTVAP